MSDLAESEDSMALGGKLAGLSLPKQVLVLALWPFLQNMLGVGVGFSDMIIAGRMATGVEATAIMDMMGAALYLMWLLMILQGAMATGAMALVSRSTGAKDMKTANLALGQSLLLGVVSGCVSGMMIWLIVPLMAEFFGLSALATRYIIDYMRVAAILAPFSGVLFVASSCLRGYGDTVKPFISMLLVNVVNVVLSFWLVYSLGWGVKGLATGTVVGWAAGALFILWFLTPQKAKEALRSSKDKSGFGVRSFFRWGQKRGDKLTVTKGEESDEVTSADTMEPLVLRMSNLRYDIPMMRRVWRSSWPTMFEIIGMWSVHAVGVYLIGTMKAGTMGAHAMVVRLESVSFMPGFAIGTAASTLAGQYLGAGDKEKAKKAVRFCWMVAVMAMGSAGVLISVFNVEFLSLFGNTDRPQFQMAAPVIRFVGLFQVLNATMIVMKMSMRGAGATRIVTAYSFLSMGLIRVGVLWVAVRWWHVDLLGVWMVMMVDVFIQATLFVWLHFRGSWLKTKV